MATIGSFASRVDTYTGIITTLTVKAKTVIKPITKITDNPPDYRVFAAGVEIGAAWSATAKAQVIRTSR